MILRIRRAKAFARRGGFSRAELVLVAATFVVSLAALPVMSQGLLDRIFGRFVRDSPRTTCQNNLKQTGLAIMQYMQDYDEKLPLISSTDKDNYGWAQCIYPYVKNREVFSCPSDRHAIGTDPKKAGYTDYWYNRNLSLVDLAATLEPSRTLMMGDGDGNSPQSNARYTLNTLPKAWITTKNSPATRHEGSANYSFVDGHVKWISPKAISVVSPVKNKGVSATFAVK